MELNMFNSLNLSMLVRHVCSWQHQCTSEKMMGTKETLYEVCFYCGEVNHGQINCSCLWLLTVCCTDWTSRDTRQRLLNLAKTRWDNPSRFLMRRRVCQIFCRTQRKVTNELCQNKAVQFFKFLALLKSFSDILGL